MSFVMDEDFECLIDELGNPDHSTPVPQDVIDKYRDLLPARLLEYWQEFGFCRFDNGLYWIVNPDDFAGIKDDWLPTDIPNRDQCHVIARNAFGDLHVWSKTEGYRYTIEPIDGRVFLKDGDEKRISQGKETQAIQDYFSIRTKYTLDREDVDAETSIFDYAIEQYGPLAEDEMFTFEPVRFLGGEQSFQNVRKVNMFIHIDILTSLAPKDVLDIHGLTKRAFR